MMMDTITFIYYLVMTILASFAVGVTYGLGAGATLFLLLLIFISTVNEIIKAIKNLK